MHVSLQVLWEAPCWWEAWGPGPLGPPSLNLALERASLAGFFCQSINQLIDSRLL